MHIRSIIPPRLRSPRGALLAVAAATVVSLAAATGFFEPISLLITVGGAIGVVCATFPRTRLRSAWHHLIAAFDDGCDAEAVIATLKEYARINRVDGPPALERAAANAADPFLRSATLLALECDDPDEVEDALTGELRVRVADGEASRQVLVTLGKLFPAFGLIGTLIGLVLLLRHLDGNDFTAIGAGLGLAVTTTLYGAVLSNVVVLPLATKLQAHLARRTLLMRMTIEGLLLVHAKEYPTRVERALRAYVTGTVETVNDRPLPAERAA